MRPLLNFAKHLKTILVQFFTQGRPSCRNIMISLSLYFIYPFTISYLLHHGHSICGDFLYVHEMDAFHSCNGIYFHFCVLMRTYKMLAIILKSNRGRVKFRICCLVGQELSAILFVSLLLVVCMPVFAFWFMFGSICVSTIKLVLMFQAQWKLAQQINRNRVTDNIGNNNEGGELVELVTAVPSSSRLDAVTSRGGDSMA